MLSEDEFEFNDADVTQGCLLEGSRSGTPSSIEFDFTSNAPETPLLDLEFDEEDGSPPPPSSFAGRHRGATIHNLDSILVDSRFPSAWDSEDGDGEDEEEDLFAASKDVSPSSPVATIAALVQAAREGKVRRLGMLCDQGLDKDGEDENGVTPLQMACAAGHAEVVNCLIHFEADLKRENSKGETPMHIATMSGHAEIVTSLCIGKANIDVPDEQGKTPLHVAAAEGHLKVAQLLCGVSADIDRSDNIGATPLLAASFHGKVKVVQFLCEEGACHDASNQEGWSPLYAACFCGHLGVVRNLLAISANPQHGACDGSTPLSIALQQGHRSVATTVQRAIEVPSMSKRKVTIDFAALRDRHRSSASDAPIMKAHRSRYTLMQDQFHEVLGQNDELNDIVRQLRRENMNLHGRLDSPCTPSEDVFTSSPRVSDWESNNKVAQPRERDVVLTMTRGAMSGLARRNKKLKLKNQQAQEDMASAQGNFNAAQDQLDIAQKRIEAMTEELQESRAEHGQSWAELQQTQRELQTELTVVGSLRVQLGQSEEALEDAQQSDFIRRRQSLCSQLTFADEDEQEEEHINQKVDVIRSECEAVVESAAMEVNEARWSETLHAERNAESLAELEYVANRKQLEEVALQIRTRDEAWEQHVSVTTEAARMAVQRARDVAVAGLAENSELQHELEEMRRSMSKTEHASTSVPGLFPSAFATCLNEEAWIAKAQEAKEVRQDIEFKLDQQENVARALRGQVECIGEQLQLQSRLPLSCDLVDKLNAMEEAKNFEQARVNELSGMNEAQIAKIVACEAQLSEHWNELEAKVFSEAILQAKLAEKSQEISLLIEKEAESKANQPCKEAEFAAMTAERDREHAQRNAELENRFVEQSHRLEARVIELSGTHEAQNAKTLAFEVQLSEQRNEMEAKMVNQAFLQAQIAEMSREIEVLTRREAHAKANQHSREAEFAAIIAKKDRDHVQKYAELEKRLMEQSQRLEAGRDGFENLNESGSLREEVRAAARAAQKARISSYEASLLVRWNEDLEDECDKLQDQVRQLAFAGADSSNGVLNTTSQLTISPSSPSSNLRTLSPRRFPTRHQGFTFSPKAQSPTLKRLLQSASG